MYLVSESHGQQARTEAALPPPFGPDFAPTLIERLEVWGSGIKDSGPDFCEYRAFDKNDELLWTRRLPGY